VVSNFFYSILFVPLYFCLPKRNWIFYSAFGYADSTKYIFDKAIAEGLECYYILDTKQEKEALIDHPHYERFIVAKTIRCYFVAAYTKVTYLTHGYGNLPYILFFSIVIQLWHGFPIKKILLDSKFDTNKYKSKVVNKIFLFFYKKRIQSYDIIIAPSETCRAIFSSAFSNEKICVLGSPRQAKLLENLKVSGGAHPNKIIFLPTWREKTLEFEQGLKELFSNDFSSFLQQHNLYLDVALHPFNSHLITNLNSSPLNRVRLINSGSDIYSTVVNYNYFIVDYSSLMFDLYVISSNLIFFAPDKFSYEKERELYFNLEEIAGSQICISVAELKERIREIRAGLPCSQARLGDFVQKIEDPIGRIIELGKSI
jgi:CDP-glycerol glycerophosphotransferase (TagB/SpsB family)